MRHLLAAVLSLSLLLSSAAPIYAQQEIRIFVDGVELKFDIPPVLENGRTLVPVRALAEALGFEVGFDGEEGRITLTRGKETIQLWLDSERVQVNGQEERLDVPASLRNGRTLVPARFVAENLGATVTWDPERWAVVVDAAPDYREMLIRATNKLDLLIDQKAKGGQLNTIEVIQGGEVVLSLYNELFVEHQIYQNEMFQVTELTPWGASYDDRITVELMIREGRILVRSGADQPWNTVGRVDPTSTVDLTTVPVLAQTLSTGRAMRTEIIRNAELTLVGTEEMDGVTVTKLQLSGPALKPFYDAEVGRVLRWDLLRNQTREDQWRMTYWVNLDTEFVHEFQVELLSTVHGLELGIKPTTVEVDLFTRFRYEPVSEPVPFPGKGPTPREEALLEALVGKSLPAAALCLDTDLWPEDDAYWNEKRYVDGAWKAKEIMECLSSVVEETDALEAPTTRTADLHHSLTVTFRQLAASYQSLQNAFVMASHGDMQEAESYRAEALEWLDRADWWYWDFEETLYGIYPEDWEFDWEW